ncbi:MAG: NAD(P)H-hydrate epimerase [Planctomycetes bacterium]|nr:NAD(P)H-hydrate epimerase [Planctomycetota bacterium]
MNGALLHLAASPGAGGDSLQGIVFLFATILGLIVVAAAALIALKRRPAQAALPPLSMLTTFADDLPLAAPEPPAGRLDRHRHETALAGRARFEACRIAADLGLSADGAGEPAGRVWILAGPGPTGALALAVARHLEAWGVHVTAQVLAPPEKLGADARRERLTLEKARFSPIDSPVPRALDGVAVLVAGVEDALLPKLRREALAEQYREAAAQGTRVDRLDAFDAVFVPPAPQREDLTIPVPGLPLTREEVRLLDAYAQEHYGMLGAALMENAGYWAARETFLAAHDLAARKNGETPRVTILCGRGNNGGDGMVVARYLLWWGLEPRVILLGTRERCSEDCGNNYDLLEQEGLKIAALFDSTQWPHFAGALDQAHLIVDAVLGTGMSGEVRGDAKEAIERINAARRGGAWVLALDCPSGLDNNTGAALGACVEADLTVTFAAPKVGFALERGPEVCGQVILADIGLPRDLYRRKS